VLLLVLGEIVFLVNFLNFSASEIKSMLLF
jgi:hypothetical protein